MILEGNFVRLHTYLCTIETFALNSLTARHRALLGVVIWLPPGNALPRREFGDRSDSKVGRSQPKPELQWIGNK